MPYLIAMKVLQQMLDKIVHAETTHIDVLSFLCHHTGQVFIF